MDYLPNTASLAVFGRLWHSSAMPAAKPAVTAIPHPLAELLSMLDASPEPHIILDPDYRIIGANTAYRKQIANGEGVIGRNCFQVSCHHTQPCDRAGESCPLGRCLASGRRERVLHLSHTANGDEYRSIELTPIRDGGGEIRYFVEKIELQAVAERSGARQLIGGSKRFGRMMDLASRVAKADAVVLLEGESGTGKELVAQAIHQMSRRAKRPFVAVDCSGIPENLFESELFGHERGAFTGAVAARVGLVEAANGGTLFLDEVGEIPLAMQVKLLRLLETSAYRRVGSSEPRRADIRVISATHRSLREMVAAGSFRADLYYRLNIFPIEVPALRERPGRPAGADRRAARAGRPGAQPSALRGGDEDARRLFLSRQCPRAAQPARAGQFDLGWRRDRCRAPGRPKSVGLHPSRAPAPRSPI